MTPMLDLDVSTKPVQNLKLTDVLACVDSESMCRPRLPVVRSERQAIEAIVAKALASRPPQYPSVA